MRRCHIEGVDCRVRCYLDIVKLVSQTVDGVNS